MSRSLKKGPYIEVKLEKKVLAMNESGKKSEFTTEINLFLFMLLKTWLDISLVSSHQLVVSEAMQVTRKNKQVICLK